jgi:hypothetical protein
MEIPEGVTCSGVDPRVALRSTLSARPSSWLSLIVLKMAGRAKLDEDDNGWDSKVPVPLFPRQQIFLELPGLWNLQSRQN